MKTLLFDLDGTLTDSGPGIMNCAQLALDHFGIPVPGRDSLRVFVGPPLRESFGKFGVPKDRLDEAIKVFRGRYTTVGKFENLPYPGIPELLKKLKEDGFKLYVATSKPEVTAKEIMVHFDLAQYFEEICGAELSIRRETKEEVITYLKEKTGAAEDLLMIGDTDYDVLGAAAHGIPTVGVTWGYGDNDVLRAAGPIATVDTPEELYAFLRVIG